MKARQRRWTEKDEVEIMKKEKSHGGGRGKREREREKETERQTHKQPQEEDAECTGGMEIRGERGKVREGSKTSDSKTRGRDEGGEQPCREGL